VTPLIECVPNFSEGRRRDVIEGLRTAASGHAGAHLLDTHSDPDHNRSVLTIAGEPDAVVSAAFAAARAAVRLIDLRQHNGVHPRMGAVDVIPLIPIEDETLDGCANRARGLARRVGEELGVPVYLYAAAAKAGRPSGLADIRGRGFEALLALGDALPQPDFGPRRLHPSAGAVAVGARPPLIAFNVLLRDTDVAAARRIAARVRPSGGGLPGVQALGLWLESRNAAQISMNLHDTKATTMAVALGRVRELAHDEKVTVAECELVGLAPESALQGLAGDSTPGVPGRDHSIEARMRAIAR